MKNSTLLLLCSLILSSCASGLDSRSNPGKSSHHTTVLFLVDGLSANILKNAIELSSMPNTQKFFLKNQTNIALGRAAFPSLTYPNISSILTARAIGEQPVTANHQVIGENKILNFESSSKHDDLDNLIDPISIFGEMGKQGKESASFAYVFGMNATTHMQAALREGLDYKNHDFRSLDARLLENLEEFLLDRGNAKKWPEFIYIHLVGVDGTAHLYGPNSKEVEKYMSWLDRRMKSTLQILARAESQGKSISTILTADHGFVQTDFYVDGEELVEKVDKKVLVTNESRFMGLYSKDEKSLDAASNKLLRESGVEMVAIRRGDSLLLKTQTQQIEFKYGPASCITYSFSLATASDKSKNSSNSFLCPSQLNALVGKYPFLVEDFANYLNTANHPDAIVLAKSNFSFTKDAKGNHGGPTADEILVPVLTRNSKIQGPGNIRTSDLLKSLFIRSI